MRRNLLLFGAILVAILLAYNSFQKIMTFRGTSRQVSESEARLEKLKQENEELKKELEYKKSDRFAEEEIRNKLGLAREGEEVFVVPKDDVNSDSFSTKVSDDKSNWEKWREYLFDAGT